MCFSFSVFNVCVCVCPVYMCACMCFVMCLWVCFHRCLACQWYTCYRHFCGSIPCTHKCKCMHAQHLVRACIMSAVCMRVFKLGFPVTSASCSTECLCIAEPIQGRVYIGDILRQNASDSDTQPIVLALATLGNGDAIRNDPNCQVK
jgi:hypothetical protein